MLPRGHRVLPQVRPEDRRPLFSRHLLQPHALPSPAADDRLAAGGPHVAYPLRLSPRRHKVALPPERRVPILKAYLGENAMTTKAHFGVDPKAELSEFEAIAARHPVFRIVAAEG